MFLSTLAPLLILPFIAAEGVHKLKLKKMPTTANEYAPDHEVMYLTQKYGGQVPILGAGGAGRRVPVRPAESDLYWTQDQQEILKDGHGVPLSSRFRRVSVIILADATA